jgi:hypothetical protein
MVFHIGFDKRISQTFLGVAVVEPVFGPSLGPVSPVFDFVQRGSVSLYLTAYGRGASSQRFGDRADEPALFQGNSDLLPLREGQMGIAFYLICVRLDHNGILLLMRWW